MGFDKGQFGSDLAGFSDGQKKKTLLAGSLCSRAHLYIWDEPLNYIDIYSRMQIEDLILQFKPTMVFVEHDKAFRNAVATKIINL
ncbi:MAG: Lsa family ABC-F type ribosomal protection protein, partial [Clostridia bacterium]|nr:Lsa family ABC-F type ribosomal protection protein [Clostridia bacterium]